MAYVKLASEEHTEEWPDFLAGFPTNQRWDIQESVAAQADEPVWFQVDEDGTEPTAEDVETVLKSGQGHHAQYLVLQVVHDRIFIERMPVLDIPGLGVYVEEELLG